MKCTQEKCPLKNTLGPITSCTAHNCKFRTLPKTPDPEPDFPLYNADPNCKHELYNAPGGGVKCKHCSGWFCF